MTEIYDEPSDFEVLLSLTASGLFVYWMHTSTEWERTQACAWMLLGVVLFFVVIFVRSISKNPDPPMVMDKNAINASGDDFTGLSGKVAFESSVNTLKIMNRNNMELLGRAKRPWVHTADDCRLQKTRAIHDPASGTYGI
jgi:hypothetical protein